MCVCVCVFVEEYKKMNCAIKFNKPFIVYSRLSHIKNKTHRPFGGFSFTINNTFNILLHQHRIKQKNLVIILYFFAAGSLASV